MMVEIISPPDPQNLLPPLLACLPTSFASPRPPPALPPLLSPILRQRLSLHTSGSFRDNWAPLLCWDSSKGEILKDRISETTFEPHPSSGEIEVGDTGPITYKRFDEETLRAQISLLDWPFTAVYLWCTGSEEGNAWKLAELLPFDHDTQKDPSWLPSISEANENAKERLVTEALEEADRAAVAGSYRHPSAGPGDDDDYWAMYDNTSKGQTPARKPSVEPREFKTSENDYYARYATVQPAMESHDPDEEMEEAGESTLNGNHLERFFSHRGDVQADRSPPPYNDQSSDGHDWDHHQEEPEMEVNQPAPSSPSSRGSDMVARLEQHAERYAASEIGIRQHISTSLKSMYRLAKSAGMDREEFDRIVQRELDTLSILDQHE